MFGDDQFAIRANSGKGRTLGNTVTAGFGKDNIRRGDKPVCLSLKRLRIKEPGRDTKATGQFMDARLVGLKINRGDTGNCLDAQALPGQRFRDKVI